MFNNAPSPGFKFRPRSGNWTDGKNNLFNPDTCEATSYNWWTYVTKINGKIVFNNYPYSVTTQGHQRNARALLKQLKIKIDVEVSMRQSLSSFYSESLPYQYEELFNIELKAKRARKNGVFVECHRKYYKTHGDAIKAIKKSIKACRQLGAKMSRDSIKKLKKQVQDIDAARLQRARNDRLKVKALQDSLKPELNDLGPISMEVYEDVNDLNEINFNKELKNA